MSNVLERVTPIIKARREAYGNPKPNFDDIAVKWNVSFGNKLAPGEQFTALDVAMAMIDVKTCRLKATPDHIDSIDDVVGYAACYEECLPKKPTEPRMGEHN